MTSSGTVLVAISYYGVPDLIGRAVDSALGQTYSDLRVVVVGDGDRPPLEPRDRLTVYSYPENRGAYFAIQVALLANPYPWFAPLGADDYLDPTHVEKLMAVGHDAVATGAVWWESVDVAMTPNEDGGKGTVTERAGTRVKDKPAGYEVGVFRTDRLRAIGGYNPAERLSQDSLLLRLLEQTGELRMTHEPTYHRVVRPGSLMFAPETNARSDARREAWRRVRSVRAVTRKLRGDIPAIAAYRAGLVPEPTARLVARHAASLREALDASR
jgi:hypothetical protein